MGHRMGLLREYMKLIKEGKKTVEVRLNDEKRQKIRIGDTIQFIEVEDNRNTLMTRVTDLKKYKCFKEMYQDIPFEYFGCENWTLEELVQGTYDIYTPELEKKYGTLAITVELI